MALFTEKVTPINFKKSMTCISHGARIDYEISAEELVLEAEDGLVGGTIFSFSYEKCTAEAGSRPILFAFNGGPGSSSLWMHMGMFGPYVVNGAGTLVENNEWLIDCFDIVMIDPVSTGYARLYREEAGESFFGAMPDALTVARFIRRWMRARNRGNSPIFLAGESYGATRASLAAYLLDDVDVRGILYIGPGYSSDWEPPRTLKDLIPASAAAWYHQKASQGQTLEQVLHRCREFLYQDYLHALIMGSQLDENRKRSVAEILSQLTGLSADYYVKHELLVSREDICKKLQEDEKEELGFFDTRYTQPAGTEDEAFSRQLGPAYRAGLRKYLREVLDLQVDRDYRYSAMDVNKIWVYESNPTMATALRTAMKAKPKLRIFFATGYFDICATVENTRFSVTHSGLPMERVEMHEYISGHMVYADDEARKLLTEDIRNWVNADK